VVLAAPWIHSQLPRAPCLPLQTVQASTRRPASAAGLSVTVEADLTAYAVAVAAASAATALTAAAAAAAATACDAAAGVPQNARGRRPGAEGPTVARGSPGPRATRALG
jgi:hypothetical protein